MGVPFGASMVEPFSVRRATGTGVGVGESVGVGEGAGLGAGEGAGAPVGVTADDDDELPPPPQAAVAIMPSSETRADLRPGEWRLLLFMAISEAIDASQASSMAT